MKIIGEKINGTRKRVKQAIEERDAAFIQNLAKEQASAGADWLDANAGTAPQREPDDLIWLVENIQAAVDTPVCLDSANPKALETAIKAVNKTPMINSISMEPNRLEGVLPIVAAHKCPAVALAMDEKGIPKTKDERIAIIGRMLEKTRALGIPDSNLYFDPLAMTIATGMENGLIFFETIREIRKQFPDVHMTCGLSNISFGMPARSFINRVFLAYSMQAGLDCAICDPNNQDIKTTMLAAELLLGQDKHCLKFTRAFRAGVFEKSK
ncbi:MAG TPA: methyltetrahydrofolate cobalamin methyltransferase [Acidobacteriota bacterium]|nr:methyltetrahydrofolate cobalamin methyltransferase [Acidobacteriota bacterium]